MFFRWWVHFPGLKYGSYSHTLPGTATHKHEQSINKEPRANRCTEFPWWLAQTMQRCFLVDRFTLPTQLENVPNTCWWNQDDQGTIGCSAQLVCGCMWTYNQQTNQCFVEREAWNMLWPSTDSNQTALTIMNFVTITAAAVTGCIIERQ